MYELGIFTVSTQPNLSGHNTPISIGPLKYMNLSVFTVPTQPNVFRHNTTISKGPKCANKNVSVKSELFNYLIQIFWYNRTCCSLSGHIRQNLNCVNTGFTHFGCIKIVVQYQKTLHQNQNCENTQLKHSSLIELILLCMDILGQVQTI